MRRYFGNIAQIGYVVRDVRAAMEHLPTNDAPSMYRDFLAAGHEGAQHVAYWTTDFQAMYDDARLRGYTIGQEGPIGGPQGRFCYFEHADVPGTVIEISDISGPKGETFAAIREAARTWDGSDPIRVIR